MKIKTERYFSTYGFVSINKLEDLADKLFGKGWEAEENLILAEKLRETPNYDYIRWLQQLSIENLKEIGKPFPNLTK